MGQKAEIQAIIAKARAYVGYENHHYIGELGELTAAIVHESNASERETDDLVLIAKAAASLHRPFSSSNASKVMKPAAELLSDPCVDDELKLLMGATLFLACHEPARCHAKIEEYYRCYEPEAAEEYDW